MLNKDPTRTLTLRRKAVAQVTKRFNEIKRVIRITLLDNRVLAHAEPADASRFVFLRDAGKVDEFMRWLHRQIQLEILNGAQNDDSNFLNAFVGLGYASGATKTRSAIGRKYGDLPVTSVFSNPAHVARAELIYTRVFSQLKGVTEVMEQQIARVLTDGIIQGKGIEEIAQNIIDRVDKIGITRARLIARTEIVNAHNLATIAEAESIEGILGVPIKMIWQTSLDGRERPTHRARHRKVYTKEKVLPLLGEPNCRCSITPWTKKFGEL